MLGWALKKSIQGATGATDAPEGAEDTTQFEAPDTPAPVFAARAIRHAIFGTPAPPKEAPADPQRVQPDTKASDATSEELRSPSKPNGILLTPGTATARRKRVSFDHDVKAGTNGGPNSLAMETNNAGPRKRTPIQQKLEDSRTTKTKKAAFEVDPKVQARENASAKPGEPAEDASEEEWDEDICNQEVTVDLNEPHSKSGKYWKSEFNTYTEDARAEMEKLVKYKYLAKRYAEKKDAEALDLNQKLKEQQEKVVQMEKRITEMTAHMTDKRRRGPDTDTAGLTKELAEKTALAIQYRGQVKELEILLKNQKDRDSKFYRRGIDTSPRTEKTLLEVNRELRRARNELKEMKNLREEVGRLKSDLLLSQQRATKLGEENKRIAGDLSQPSWVQKLEKQLRESKDKMQQRADELQGLRKEYDTLKENAKAQRSQALQVLKEKNSKIADLEKEVKTLKERHASSSRPKSLDAALAEHSKITRDLKSDMATLSKPFVYERAKTRQQPKRSLSAEDLTLDMSNHSIFADGTIPKLSVIPRETWPNRRSSGDWTASLLEMEEQLKKEKLERLEARKRDRGVFTNDLDMVTSKSLETSKASQMPTGSRRVMSDRVNLSSPKAAYQGNKIRRVTSAYPPLDGDDKAILRGALDSLAAYRYPTKSHSTRPLSSSSEAPAFDLMQDRFARLGGPNPNDTALTANASRCTLPADRQSAARARLEQKRRERQHVGARANNKENMRP
ncbi:spindle pole body formation-associated protein-domain-containing protein [Xylariales sp. AK1849]|nr:spindle pole body formation-associated protein-domain-containing protein [Xylariales sp. AK1849]